jgi:hypothetical protein
MLTVSQLLESMAEQGLNVARTGTDSFEVVGQIQNATPELLESLKYHRGVFLQTLPIRKSEAERMAESQNEYVDWLNRAMPKGYRLNDHLDFWQKHDRRLNLLLRIGDADFIRDYLVKIRWNVVWHFTPFHPRPKPGETVVFFPEPPLGRFQLRRKLKSRKQEL